MRAIFSDLMIRGVALALLGAAMPPGVSDGEGGYAPKAVASIDNAVITSKDLCLRIKTEEAYGNTRATGEVALVSLVADAVKQRIATAYGVAPTEEEVRSFARYVDEHSKAPEILARVKFAFGEETALYERLYLAPKIVDQKLRSYFTHDEEIHRPERRLIQKVFGLVSSGKTFAEAASEFGLAASTFEIEDKENDPPPELKPYLSLDSYLLRDPLVSVLELLSPGQVCTKIVENDSGYMVLRLVARKGSTHRVEAITVRKKPFEEWLKVEASRIRIEILDGDLGNAIREKQSDLWFLGTSP